MAIPRVFQLEPIRTDGWFERIGESIGSFQALCDIVGPRFFAFAMITGARIVALTIDRKNPDNTLVDFAVDTGDAAVNEGDTQRLTLADFRRRLVNALLTDESTGTAPERSTDLEALQLHIGVRYLLLAPLYGYGLQELSVAASGSTLKLQHEGVEQEFDLESFRARLKAHVREELERATQGSSRNAIELSRVADAEAAAERGDHVRILELLGAWPAPLAIFLRTPEGQLLGADVRATIARGLGLLGSACIRLGEVEKGEEILRLAVQFAGDGVAAADIYLRLGEAIQDDGRPGEAIGPLRRAANLGAPAEVVWPRLAEAFVQRQRWVAALAACEEARHAGIPAERIESIRARVESQLGRPYVTWHETRLKVGA